MERLSFDTTFLIDLQRERCRGEAAKRPAHRFLQANDQATIEVSAVVLGEYAEGFAEPRDAIELLIRDTNVLSINEEVAIRYGVLVRQLRETGQLIGTNDLWIAATSLTYGLPLVTRNREHFARISQLTVVSY